MRANYQRNAGGQNLNAMLQQAQKMQEDMAAKQAELEERDLMIKSMRGDNVAYRECIRRMEQRCENFVNYIAKNGWNV